MAELTISQIIKLILGILVVVAVIGAVYFVFKNYVIDFISNVVPDRTGKLILSLL